MSRSHLLWLACILEALACARPPGRLPAEPGVTFAAHRDGDRFVLDRSRAGGSALLDRPGRLHGPNAPDFLLRVDEETRAALWVIGRSRVLVRAEDSTIAPRRGEVLSDWDAGAIRLTLFVADGSSFRTDPFVRKDGRTLAREALERPPDLGGAYRAEIRNGLGAPVGWMRVQTHASEDGLRLYDGVFPPGIDDALAAAAAVALDAEIAWIAGHGPPRP